ncbi:MAG: hypothetical protein WD490_04960 [Opitutales bacterium]
MNAISILLRVVAILGAAAAVALFFILGDEKDQLRTELDLMDRQLNQAEAQLSTLRGEREEMEVHMAQLESELEQAHNQLSEFDAHLQQAEEYIVNIEEDFQQTLAEAETMADEITRLERELSQARAQATATEGIDIPEEMLRLQEEIANLEGQLAQAERLLAQEGLDPDAIDRDAAREILRAQVAEVGPESSFIILDRGAGQGFRRQMNLLVYRDGTFLARARITSLEEDISIAQILPQSLVGEIQPGDSIRTIN